ncbi:MAG TPA: alpha-amylase family glycosyl hydrolase, partial [Flavobacteriaceae bacterium]|nr:alpha-amylase family glycosyl hydrolase [Flavobacteriaceae bacterium]
MKQLISLLMLMLTISINAQEIDRIEPPNWWVGMENSNLELMIYGKNISTLKPVIKNSNVKINMVKLTNNPNYLFLNLNLADAAVGKFTIGFNKNNKEKLAVEYTLKARKENAKLKEGFNSSDAIYLITPDRFANGNPKNDLVKGMLEEKIDRDNDYGRHGGDIAGITNHVDYIHNLGFTAIWPTPVLENNMKESSYHGYAITDLYKPDARFGTLEEYIELSSKLNQKGMKLIMDQVANHIGSEHWWMNDLPATNWLNFQQKYEKGIKIPNSNHRRTTNQDLYASEIDKKGMSKGWFVSAMPDLNQKNPLLATYLIQNSIWWIETLNLGGIRQDTYPYPNKQFMSNWAGAIMNEYPNFSIVGEEWSYNPLLVGYWQQGANNKDGYVSNLTSTMDFPMQSAIVQALNEAESWDKGFVKIYEGLANDFYYPNPEAIMVFPDNHDMSRIHTQLKEDFTNTKMAIGYLSVLPRVVQFYYGTEILLNDSKKPGDHGLIRSDFPGGWKS